MYSLSGHTLNTSGLNNGVKLKVLHLHLSLNNKGHWSATDDFTTSFLHFPLFSTALWDLANSRPVHSLMMSSHFFCLPCLLSPFTLSCKMVNRKHVHTTSVCVSLRWSGGLCVVQLHAGFWHRLPHWLHSLCMRCVVSCSSTSF